MSVSLPYRADIDGLRAIAVLSVVLFHAKVGPFTGGYVGVDIFFVISGFLITSILVKDLEAGTFSFAKFYERRIRRIFPALFTVVLTAAVAGWFILTPQDYRVFALSMIHLGGFVSNVFFKQRAGYFGPAAETQPLLHSWSLAVEEQFYVIAPFALLLLFRFTWKSRGRVLAAVAVISLASAAHGVSLELPSAFYYLHSRAWELLTGMLLGLGVVPLVRAKPLAEVMAMTGVAMIACAVFLFTPATPFPGFAALMPCLGAAFIIHSGAQASTFVSRFLSLPTAVFTGKISYSLYLWHWPLLVFANYEWGADVGTRERLGLVALAVVLSILTWAFIEQPARKYSAPNSHRPALASGLAVIAACCATGYVIKTMNGFDSRLPPQTQAFLQRAVTQRKINKSCREKSEYQLEFQGGCRLGDAKQSETTFILWGDSHASVIADKVSAIATSASLKGGLITAAGCPPLLGLEDISRQSFATCIKRFAPVIESLRLPSIKRIIIAARWASYSEGEGVGLADLIGAKHFVDGDRTRNRAEFERLLRKTIAAITSSGRSVTILGPVPELPYNLPSTVIRDTLHGKVRNYALPLQDFLKRQSFVLPLLANMGTLPGVRVLYPHRDFCDASICTTIENGVSLYTDDTHLSGDGVNHLQRLLEEALAP